MARPNKAEQAIIAVRNKHILAMVKKGYPQHYISAYFNVTPAVVTRVIKKINEKAYETNENNRVEA